MSESLLPVREPRSDTADAEIDGAEAIQPVSGRSVLVWQIAIVGVLLAFLGILALRLWQTNTAEQRAAGMAPNFSITTFAGDTLTLDDLKGKGVVVNFWASWCDPCREEAALLEATWRREQENGIVFVGLGYLDQEPAALDYLEEFEVTYPNGPDLRSEAARRYAIKGVPETFFIDGEGRIVHTIVGPVTDAAALDALMDQIRPETTAVSANADSIAGSTTGARP